MHKLYSIQQSPVTIIYSTSHALIVMGRGIVMVSSKGQRQNSIIHSKSSPQAATNTPLLIKYFKISSFYHFQDHNTFRNLCIFYEYYLLLKCVFENFLDNEHWRQTLLKTCKQGLEQLFRGNHIYDYSYQISEALQIFFVSNTLKSLWNNSFQISRALQLFFVEQLCTETTSSTIFF